MRNLFTFLFLTVSILASGQNVDLANGVFGNEWIDYDKTYVKIKVAEDDIYKLTYQDLQAAGVPISTISGNTLRLQHLGNNTDIYISNEGIFTSEDYILFYGKKNRAELDQYLYNDPENYNVNDRYSMVSDTSAYFLSWGNALGSSSFIKDKTIDYTQTLPETRVYKHIDEIVYSTEHYKPVENSNNVRFSSFVRAEGYGTKLTNSHTESFEVIDRVNIGIQPTISWRFGTNLNELNTKVTINNADFKTYFKKGFDNYLVALDTFIDYSQVIDKLDLKFTTSGSSRINVGNIEFTYTRTIDAANGIPDVITIPADDKDRFLRIKNYTNPAVDVINLTTGELYNTTIQNNNLVIFIPISQQEQQLAFVNPAATSPLLSSVDFIDFSKQDHDYVILTTQKLNNNEDNNGNPIQDYVDYRSSLAGGRYNATAVNVEDLYDQFAFGIDRHFLAIRHFAHYIKSNWTDVQFMFIIGKGREYANQRKDFQINNTLFPQMLVPTYGMPGADNLLVSGVNSPVLIYPIGRFAANDKQQVYDYLDKIIDHDANRNNPPTIEDRLWMKNVIHLSGGDAKIQESIRSQLDDMQSVIESSKMGAEVTTFAKFSSEPIEVAISEDLRNRIRDGVAITTFFGHSAVGNLDFSLGDIKTLDNKGKYPLMIALGCNAGNIHGSSTGGVSESYVSVKDRGMIAFLASVGSAYAYQQYLYGQKLYDVMGNVDYGLPIGTSINAIIDTFKNDASIGVRTFLEQVTLHGDPAITLISSPSTDLIPNGKVAFTIPVNVNSYEPNFTFCYDLVNIGFSNKDSITVNIQHLYADESLAIDTSYKTSIPNHTKQECITLPILDNSATGQQTIKVFVDSENVIAEVPAPAAEDNNRLVNNSIEGFKFYMLNNAAKPIYPMEFGITNKIKPTLLASTFNAFDKPQDFIIQFDTSGYFDSPSLVSEVVKDQVALIEWTVPYDLAHERVYYWRVSPDTSSSTNNNIAWNESSFMYHKDIEGGWNQSHYHQFLKDDFENMQIDSATREFRFAKNFIEYRLINRQYLNSVDRPHFYTNGNSRNEPFTTTVASGISVSIIDPEGSFVLTPFPETEYETFNNRNKPIFAWLFRNINEREVRQNLMRFLENEVPDGYSVVINTIQTGSKFDYNLSEWENDKVLLGTDLFEILKEKGAENIDDLKFLGSVPYLLYYTEGVGKIDEKIGLSLDDEITMNFQVPSFWDNGSVLSTIIGPSLGWKSITWKEIKSNIPENDTTSLNIYGITNQNKTLLQEDIISEIVDISSIDHSQYPFIQLEFKSIDNKNLTTSNLIKWNTLFEGVPDLFINNDSKYLVYNDSLQQGDNFRFTIPYTNYSNVPLGKMKATISIIDQNNEEEIVIKDIDPINPNQTNYISFDKETAKMLGDYSVNLNINSDQNPMEQYYFNNFGNQRFHVYKETINPLLDVTFDGLHILDNDIVSPSPLIMISLKDENPYLLLDDTSLYTLTLTSPDGQSEELTMDDPRLVFSPATSADNNSATLEFRPTFLIEGEYMLSVRSKDITGNISGASAYEVSFQVILKNQISEVYNYPNPFSTSTEFIFTLTGNEIPDNFTIQIMTISGKVVKEIDQAEFGPIRIGLNRSQYKWDGRDDYGSPLANGVYLYKVLTNKSDGNAFDRYETENTAQFFKDGWGKLVILR